MKQHRIRAVITSFVVLLTSALAVAQGTGPIGLQRVNHDTTLTGSGTTAAPLGTNLSVASPVSGTGSAGSPLTSSGDISAVTAGTSLSGGGTSGAVTLNLNMPGASCSLGSVLTALGATGIGTCTAIGTAGGVTSSTLTANTIAKATSASALGNSLWTDNGTTTAYNTNKATIDAATGNTAIAGTLDAVGAISENGARVFSDAGNGLSPFNSTIHVGQGTNIAVNANDVALATNVAIGGTLSVIAGATTLSAINGTTINPTGLTGTLTDWAPAGLATATIIKMSTSGNVTLTGIDAPTDGRIITLYNAGPNIVTLTHNATSTVGKRFLIPEAGNWSIRSGSSVNIHGDATAGFWILEENTRYPNLTADSSLSSPGTNSLGTTTITTLTGLDGLTANLAVTAQTASTSPLVANNTGTYNATAAVRSSYAGRFTNSATRSAGANNVTDYGIWSSASGGQVNYAAWFDAGDVTINTGALTVSAGLTTLGGGTTATGTVGLGTLTTGTTTIKGPGVFDQTLGVTGIATLGGGTDASNTVNLGKVTTGTTTIRGPAVLDQTLTAKGNITRGTSTTVFHVTDLDTSLRPTLGSGGANCGTAATLKGNDASGVITVGTGGASACTLTLNTALSANGTCVGTLRGAASTYQVTGAVTGFTVTAALGAGAKIDYWCADH